MYINFTDIVNKWGKPKGVVHIGAHLLEEREEYIKHNLCNTIWIEANPHTFNQLMLLDRCNDELFFNQCITDKDDEIHNFHITNNGQSSSILELHKHEEYHPHIFVTDSIEVKSKRMDSLIFENGINIQNYDFLNLDIQGAELLAIKSFGELIDNFKYIYTEVNTNYLYKDNALMSEIDEYLKKYNFTRVETVITDAEWGDALYVKEELTSQKLIFDIGAHYGLFTEECKRGWPNSKVIIVEANETLWNSLHSKYEFDKSVVPLHYLASDKTADYKTFHISNYDQISTASEEWIENSRFKEHNFDYKVGVVTVNLDTLIKIFGNPDLIKIDVEGYEYEVISGLTQKTGEICFEWAEEQYDKINLTCQKLKELGYNNFGYILGDEYLKRPEIFTSWETSDFHQIVNPEDKQKWGMIWVN